jgi:FkbM family methyltransferase
MQKSSFLNRLPLTHIKIFIAQILFRVVTLFFGKKLRVINRNGINYEVDLAEGIDLSLFLFGNFQKHVTNNKFLSLKPDAVIFDVGANVGIMSLQFAQSVPSGSIYSFEPTHYALSKFKRNLELNPALAKNIKVINSFVSAKNSDNADIKAFSSWKVDGANSNNIHPVHRGTAKSTEGVPAITLNNFCEKNQISRLDFIKIDTDGHEFEVMQGAKEAIARYRPKIIFEIGIYVMEEKNISFQFYSDYFNALNYKLLDAKSGSLITTDNYLEFIPARGTIDILALPN